MEQVGVKLKTTPKVLQVRADVVLKSGQKIVVETDLGLELGEVCTNTPEKNLEAKFVRVAEKEDIDRFWQNQQKARQYLDKTKKFVKRLCLEMKIFDAILTLDEKKLLVYFTADGRVDFRELVKLMASDFKKRIELHQVGARDEVQQMGSIGICGRNCCCGQFLKDFNHVSIKMAKVQGLSLMPNNITGACGKLLCCLEYENEEYLKLYKEMPAVGSEIQTPDGKGKVVFNNLVKKLVSVKLNEEVKEYPLETLLAKEKNGKKS